MTVLTGKKRSELGDAMFGLPSERKFPLNDRAHAANAKARAAQQVGKSITPAQQAAIDQKANRVLGK